MINKEITKLVQEIKIHAVDYALLFTISIMTMIFLINFRGQRSVQLTIFIFYALCYIGWSLLHHIKSKTFHHKIIMEYILIAGCILMTLLVFF